MKAHTSHSQRRSNSYPLWSRGIEILAISAFSLMAGASLLAHLAWMLEDFSVWSIVFAFLALLVAFVVADFISGLAHFLCDNFGSPNTKILGPLFIRHFLIHHEQPNDICQHDFIETNGNNFLACSVLLFPVFYVTNIEPLAKLNNLTLLYLWLCVFLAFTNQSHKWAHEISPPQFVKRLQRYKLLLRPAEHLTHHHPPYSKNYCICSGILNKPLQRVKFFEGLYALLSTRNVE